MSRSLATSERQGYGKRVIGAFDVGPGLPRAVWSCYSPGLPGAELEATDRLVLAWLRGVRDYLDAFTRDRDREVAITALRKHGIDYSSLVQNPTFDPNGRFQIDGLRSPLRTGTFAMACCATRSSSARSSISSTSIARCNDWGRTSNRCPATRPAARPRSRPWPWPVIRRAVLSSQRATVALHPYSVLDLALTRPT